MEARLSLLYEKSYLCMSIRNTVPHKSKICMSKDIASTPMMKQFFDLKAKHPDAVMLFRCGDFYETYCDDAVVAADILGITLTKRNNGKAGQVIEMAGFPHHALDTYLPKLIRAGKRVAICDQLEDPKLAKKLVKRGITELVTPGGLHIHENQCHQGVGYERMLDCFHYDGASLEETCRRWKVDPVDLHGDAGVQVRSYIDKRYTSLFSMKHVTVEQSWTVPRGGRLQIWIVLEGQGVLETEEERLPIRQGDFLLLPAAMPAATVRREGETVRLLACDPPIPVER